MRLLVNEIFDAYNALHLERPPIGISDTIASKVLFAIRPNSLVPWDNGTRKNLRDNEITKILGLTRSINSYKDFLNWLRSLSNELKEQCLVAGFQLHDLPKHLGANNKNNNINVTMLLNEYIFIKVGKKDWQPPDINMLKNWVNWSQL